ncbi:MAG: SDR family oxidoreductase [Phycisphaerae bacterium]
MSNKLRDLDEQTILITGATSGIGLTTARMAAKAGANVVLFARDEGALRDLAGEINGTSDGGARGGRKQGRAAFCAGDVASLDDLRHCRDVAENAFGRIDAWVNNAGVSIYGPIMDVNIDDARRLFETNFWGLVHGSRVAAEYFRDHAEPGIDKALINVGSVLSDRAIPLQGFYCASKHAVKGFTDSLRMELEKDGVPVSVTLIKPGSIDTPYNEHGANLLEKDTRNPPPVYAPETVARAIVWCCHHHERDVVVGFGGKAISALGTLAPRLMDKLMEGTMFAAQKQSADSERTYRNLYAPSGNLRERSNYNYATRERSYYTASGRHGLAALGTLAALGIGAAAVATLLRNGD